MTHQSTIAVLENRVSCIHSGYSERQNAHGMAGWGEAG